MGIWGAKWERYVEVSWITGSWDPSGVYSIGRPLLHWVRLLREGGRDWVF